MNGMTERMEELDEEWQELMVTARRIGLSVEQVRLFLTCPHPGAIADPVVRLHTNHAQHRA
ncbi:anti-repressor SinI family protein [Gorillibacterium timonense]|uniref:anti-repressor SinI family protein n=1 Tax=Gorillibacterium timonense TaxID=1689269 RepID=UPI00071DCB4A|nr:anti-repressor SinI family protein [Gorillibacterium timonense]